MLGLGKEDGDCLRSVVGSSKGYAALFLENFDKNLL